MICIICIVLWPSSLSSSPSIICIELDTRFSSLLISPFLTIAFVMKSTYYHLNQNQTCSNQYCWLVIDCYNEPREYSWKLPLIPTMSNNWIRRKQTKEIWYIEQSSQIITKKMRLLLLLIYFLFFHFFLHINNQNNTSRYLLPFLKAHHSYQSGPKLYIKRIAKRN